MASGASFPPQHALRLAAFGQLHKVLGMDPLPSKMPKKPKNENPVDYTGECIGVGGPGWVLGAGRIPNEPPVPPVLSVQFRSPPAPPTLSHP